MLLMYPAASVNFEDGGFGYFDGEVFIDIPLGSCNHSDFESFFSELNKSSNASALPYVLDSSNSSLYSNHSKDTNSSFFSRDLFKRAAFLSTVGGNSIF